MQPPIPPPTDPDEDGPSPDDAAPSPNARDDDQPSLTSQMVGEESYEAMVSLLLLSEATKRQLQRLHHPDRDLSKVQRLFRPLRGARPPLVEERERVEKAPKGKTPKGNRPPPRQESTFRLTDAGRAALRNDPRYPQRTGPDQYAARLSDPTRSRTLEHDLQATEAIVSMVEAARRHDLSGAFLRREIRLDPDQRAPRIDAVVVLHVHGARAKAMMCWTKDLPGKDERRLVVAIESDMDTEAISVIRGKARNYARAFAKPSVRRHWAEHYGHVPLILWVVPDEARLEQIGAAWADEWPDGDWAIATPEQMQANRFLLNIGGNLHPASLFEHRKGYCIAPPGEAPVPLPAVPAAAAAGLPPPAPHRDADEDSQGEEVDDGEFKEVEGEDPIDAVTRRLDWILRDVPSLEEQNHQCHPAQDLTLQIVGDLGEGQFTSSLGYLDITFRNQVGDELAQGRYVSFADNTHTFSVPRPRLGSIYISIAEAYTVSVCEPRATRHFIKVNWPPAPPPPPPDPPSSEPWSRPEPPLPRWDASPLTVREQVFMTASMRLNEPSPVQCWMCDRLMGGARWVRHDLATATVLPPLQPPSAIGTVLWRFIQGLAGTLAVVRAAGAALLGLVLVALLTLSWALRAVAWGVATVWRALARNPYDIWLWSFALSLVLLTLGLGGMATAIEVRHAMKPKVCATVPYRWYRSIEALPIDGDTTPTTWQVPGDAPVQCYRETREVLGETWQRVRIGWREGWLRETLLESWRAQGGQ